MTQEDGAAARPRRVTVVTLSKLAGVAPSTITRALKGDPRISPKTREKISALAKEYGYTPNALARTLSSGRSGLYGIVLGPESNPLYSHILHAAMDEAESIGCRLLMLHIGMEQMDEKTAEALLQYQVDGCLITSAAIGSRAADICRENNVPLVMVNRVAERHGSFVSCDNRAGAGLLAKHLLQTGRRKFAVIRPPQTSSTARDRENGFTEVLADAGIAGVMRLNYASGWDEGYAAGGVLAGMLEGEQPDAVFALSDILAMGVIDGLRAAGIRVPQDIAVVGFDGLPESQRPTYQLTTVEQPIRMMINRAFKLLEARTKDYFLPDEQVSLGGRLLIGKSSQLT
ncbi:LacI family DNA-binding transcriptional regulator [Falsigemmobacter intermedius]|uniref:LacI family transcriptional regulator n=1 Tax=Falsigemmobacter intermedius TaxID=1553448 RepID=A0A3S3ULR4_9RHOB|nr:LacI family DNA-binding transcriptional regulator [Falsigemmobacter intermedius]RWY36632.1 LacI family transcriptional regulator [Falsigemmobacter intermedius]